MLNRFVIDVGSFLAPKIAPKMIQKTYQKIDSKIIGKWSQNGLQNRVTPLTLFLLFGLFFGISFLRVPRAPPGTQNERFWLPKWTPKASKMVTERPQQTPKMQHKRPMPKSRIRNLQGHSKEDLRQKGATEVLRAECSIDHKRSRS